jgi:hypothetical protein
VYAGGGDPSFLADSLKEMSMTLAGAENTWAPGSSAMLSRPCMDGADDGATLSSGADDTVSADESVGLMGDFRKSMTLCFRFFGRPDDDVCRLDSE